jgi:hypothetical protein
VRTNPSKSPTRGYSLCRKLRSRLVDTGVFLCIGLWLKCAPALPVSVCVLCVCVCVCECVCVCVCVGPACEWKLRRVLNSVLAVLRYWYRGPALGWVGLLPLDTAPCDLGQCIIPARTPIAVTG